MNLLRYRQGELSDLDDIESLVNNAIIEMNNKGIKQWDKLYPIREDFEEDIKKKQLFVGLLEEEIAVIYTLNREYDEEYINGQWKYAEKSFSVIHRLCVNPKFQNKGIAKETMRQIEKTVLTMGHEAIRLDVFSENPYALKLYNHCGYTEVGEVHWRKGKFYLMEKYL